MNRQSFKRIKFSPHPKTGRMTGCIFGADPMEKGKVLIGDACISEKGYYDVECVPLHSGRGFLVFEAKRVYDEIQVVLFKSNQVQIHINGKMAQYREGDRYVALSFCPARYHEPEYICNYIKKKVAFYDFGPTFCLVDVLDDFRVEAKRLLKEYVQRNHKRLG